MHSHGTILSTLCAACLKYMEGQHELSLAAVYCCLLSSCSAVLESQNLKAQRFLWDKDLLTLTSQSMLLPHHAAEASVISGILNCDCSRQQQVTK